MKLYHFLLALALWTTADQACAFPPPAQLNALRESRGTLFSASQARGDAVTALKLIEVAIAKKLQLACNRCRSGFALKVVEEAMRSQPALTNEQYREVERLRAEAQSLYDEKKYVESLELMRQAQDILGIDASGAIQAPPTTDASGPGAARLPVR